MTIGKFIFLSWIFDHNVSQACVSYICTSYIFIFIWFVCQTQVRWELCSNYAKLVFIFGHHVVVYQAYIRNILGSFWKISLYKLERWKWKYIWNTTYKKRLFVNWI